MEQRTDRGRLGGNNVNVGERAPDEVQLGTCCPDDETVEADALNVLAALRVEDPHLPERDEAVAVAQRIYQPPKLPLRWVGQMRVEKYRGAPVGVPYEVIESKPNLLLDDGIAFLLDRIIGTSGTSFSNANARICVGDGITAPDPADTDLAGGNTTRLGMDATFPSRSGSVMTFKSTFGTGDANHAWLEWGLANSGSGALLLNRSLESFGTKTGADTWVATLTCTMSG